MLSPPPGCGLWVVTSSSSRLTQSSGPWQQQQFVDLMPQKWLVNCTDGSTDLSFGQTPALIFQSSSAHGRAGQWTGLDPLDGLGWLEWGSAMPCTPAVCPSTSQGISLVSHCCLRSSDINGLCLNYFHTETDVGKQGQHKNPIFSFLFLMWPVGAFFWSRLFSYSLFLLIFHQ